MPTPCEAADRSFEFLVGPPKLWFSFCFPSFKTTQHKKPRSQPFGIAPPCSFIWQGFSVYHFLDSQRACPGPGLAHHAADALRRGPLLQPGRRLCKRPLLGRLGKVTGCLVWSGLRTCTPTPTQFWKLEGPCQPPVFTSKLEGPFVSARVGQPERLDLVSRPSPHLASLPP